MKEDGPEEPRAQHFMRTTLRMRIIRPFHVCECVF